MRNFAIYHHPHRGYEAVKQGFSWPGFWFTWIWAFVKKLPVLGVVLLVGLVLLRVLMETREPVYVWLGAIATIVIAVTVGIKGNEWRENSLLGRGYQLMDTLPADNPDVAINKLVQMKGNQNMGSPTEVGGEFCEHCGQRIAQTALFCQFCGYARNPVSSGKPSEVGVASELQGVHHDVTA